MSPLTPHGTVSASAPKIYVAGHGGVVGSFIVHQRVAAGHPPDRIVTRTRVEVGGIQANNTCPADFIYQNLLVQAVGYPGRMDFDASKPDGTP